MKIPNPTNSEKAWRSSGCIDEDQWCHPPNPYKGATHQDTATVSSPVFFTRQRLSREICRDFLKGRCSRQPCPYLHENPLASHQEQQLWREYCRDFLKGRCSRQPCPYLHNYPPSHQELQPQGEYCRDFLKGQCYRHPCPYVHGNHPDRHQSQPLPKGYCRSYLRGQCYRRPCPYIHDDPPDSETEFATYHSRALSAMSTESFARASVMPAPSTTETESLGCSFSSTSSTLASDTGQPFPNKQTTPESPLVVTLSDHTKVTLTKGFEVQEVKTGFETRWIHVGNVISNVKSSTLTTMFAAFGLVEALHVSQLSDAKGLVQVQFSTPAEALEAVTKLNGSTFAGKKLTAKLSINNSGTGNATLKDNSVRLEWHAPARLGYAGYATLDAAMAVVKNADGFKLEQYLISAALYDGLPAVGAYNVIFRNLPPNSTQKDLEQFGAAESIMLDRPNYTSADSATKFIRKLSEECGEILRFYTPPPPFQDGTIKAWIDFASPHEAQIAVEHMDGRRPMITGKTAISVCHLQTVSYTLPRHVYEKMDNDITLLSSLWQNKHGSTVTIEDQSLLQKGYITIKLSSVNTAQLSRLKHDFERLLRGEVVLFDKKPVWDGFFARPCGLAYLKALERRYNGMEVQRDLKRRTITLFGPIEKRQDIRREIVKKYMALRAQQFWTIPITGRLIGLFLCSDLIKLQEDLGPENCILDLKIRALVIRGNEQVFQLACKVVRLAQSRQADEHQRPPSVMCPVCLSEPILPTTLDCGHQWCQSCLCDYLVAAKDNKFFPLTCLGGDASCTHRISLTVAQKLLSAAEFEAIAEASFWKYVHSRPEEFFHCPTPDCSQVYRSAPPDAVLQCPSCLVRICPACHVEYHDGITCEERDVAEDKLFTEWTENHDVKSCPGCKAMIERSAGCNHMTCTRCQTHICWECLATFPKGEGIYDHMRTFHGGIGL
ncbi:hypothetical protein BJ138DRAFT_116853 [Hygrophoropsis aurantiaca]|uniref:Uncharacterized protein n=1 Tax=Hygrophoropsis aurantiaca TaxID=72124 RepID=A0ACB8AB72_9AGAM|nr:hypothetical protein BJ138DRAFT_116853 [Hygrophoropsis aurantiaca]